MSTLLSGSHASVGTRPLQVAVLGEPVSSWPALRELIAAGDVRIEMAGPPCGAAEHPAVASADAVVVIPPARAGVAELEAFLRRLGATLTSHRLGALVVTTPALEVRRIGSELIMPVRPDISPEELWGRLETIARYRPLLAEMEHQIENMQRLGKRLNRHFVELDQEMRLASRLQRDFLPRELPEVQPARFAALFRPASWVSGDIYDVYRVDESHVAFYVADAVGHGVASGLLTMFIKQAVQSKRIDRSGYEILSPSETLSRLNTALTEQRLLHCQFVTACYCLLDMRTLELHVARAGHPYPLHVTASGAIQEIKVEGGLLGVFEGEEFPTTAVQLHPGDRVLLYSDGLEPTLLAERDRHTGVPRFTPILTEAARLPADGLAGEIARHLDGAEGSLNPQDDITLVVLEV